MPQLIIEQPDVQPMTVPVAGAELCLGRAEDNDIVLVADEVSRHHARLRRRGDEVVLTDRNSLNGTYVNRERIVERALSHLDEIWLGGKCRLVYRDDTSFGREVKAGSDSTLMHSLKQIRDEMDRAGSSMSVIGQTLVTPVPVKGAPTPPPEATPEELITMARAFRRLAALYKASRDIASEFDLSKRLAAVLDTAVDVLGAERGFVLLRDENSSRLKVSVAREMGHDLAASSPSMGIAGRAAIDGEPVLMGDASTDPQFGMRDSIIRQQIISAMCVPLRIEDRVLGSIYVDARRRGVSFDEQDVELFASLASQSALAIDNAQLYHKMVEAEKKRSALGRFLSPAIVEEIMREEAALELGGRNRTVTALFCDIRGFTPIAERMAPTQTVEMLNEHFTAMTDIVFEFEGTLDKYIGDEIMAVFGAPLSSANDAEKAVRAAIAIQSRNAELNKQRTEERRALFELGIGINTGDVIAGYIGSPMRMEFTVVGDSVNTARRLCDVAKAGQVVVGGATYAMVKERVEARPIGDMVLEGKATPVAAYEVLAMKA